MNKLQLIVHSFVSGHLSYYSGIKNNEINFAMFISVYMYLEVVFLDMFVSNLAFIAKSLSTVAITNTQSH